MKANCPKCQQQTIFTFVKNKKYKCEKCKTILHKCRKDGCINMVSLGFYCPKCVGSGFKEAGAGALTVVTVVGGIAIKLVLGGKGRKNV